MKHLKQFWLKGKPNSDIQRRLKPLFGIDRYIWHSHHFLYLTGLQTEPHRPVHQHVLPVTKYFWPAAGGVWHWRHCRTQLSRARHRLRDGRCEASPESNPLGQDPGVPRSSCWSVLWSRGAVPAQPGNPHHKGKTLRWSFVRENYHFTNCDVNYASLVKKKSMKLTYVRLER